ncbi:siderophore-interacting protein [Micromonospora chalcea]|uniref:siderophore-interacting protein n=1 Tax=Micromonospora chalcea TaxID=1874 RepID=UPI0016568F8F|nr:siderophore-interacting protein [Micromonospora chalcea]MBC8991450.1 siderophore-interacting protein [Micromonospora chalcea]
MSALTERLANLVGDVLLGTAQVTGVRSLPGGLVLVELTAGAFRKATWTPGWKLRIRARRGTMALRTYTPINADIERGTVELIGFVHAGGPGAQWFQQAAIGDTCEIFGPHRSMDLTSVAGRALFVGDETSLGLACALHRLTGDATYLIEAQDPAGLSEALSEVGIDAPVTVLAKDADHTDLVRRAADRVAGHSYTLVVTGDAATVHTLRRASRNWSPAPERVLGKAYWAAGRTGLD